MRDYKSPTTLQLPEHACTVNTVLNAEYTFVHYAYATTPQQHNNTTTTQQQNNTTTQQHNNNNTTTQQQQHYNTNTTTQQHNNISNNTHRCGADLENAHDDAVHARGALRGLRLSTGTRNTHACARIIYACAFARTSYMHSCMHVAYMRATCCVRARAVCSRALCVCAHGIHTSLHM